MGDVDKRDSPASLRFMFKKGGAGQALEVVKTSLDHRVGAKKQGVGKCRKERIKGVKRGRFWRPKKKVKKFKDLC